MILQVRVTVTLVAVADYPWYTCARAPKDEAAENWNTEQINRVNSAAYGAFLSSISVQF